MRSSQNTVDWESLRSAESGLGFDWLSDGAFRGRGSLSAQFVIVELSAEVDLVVLVVLCSSQGSEL